MARGRIVPKALFDVREDIGRRYWKAVTSTDGGPWAGQLYLAIWLSVDVEGRFRADGDSIDVMLGRIGTTCELDASRLAKYLGALVRCGLVRIWGAGDEFYGDVVHFFEYNVVRRDREAESTIPAPPRTMPSLRRLHRGKDDSRSTPGALRRGRSKVAAEGKVIEMKGSPAASGSVFGSITGGAYDVVDAASYREALERLADS